MRFISVVVKGMHKFILKNLIFHVNFPGRGGGGGGGGGGGSLASLGRSLAALGRAPRIITLQSIFETWQAFLSLCYMP